MLLLGSTALASAADLGPRTYAKGPMPAPVMSWNGFYIGAMGGYAWQSNGSNGFGDIKGGFAGATVGYNWQFAPTWLFGIEADGGWADISQTIAVAGPASITSRANAVGSVAARFGYVAGPALVYAKGGYAFGQNEFSVTAGGVTIRDSQMHGGFTVGGGLEYMFAPNWSIKGEYMFTRFQSETYTLLIPIASGELDLHTAKIGVNYHF